MKKLRVSLASVLILACVSTDAGRTLPNVSSFYLRIGKRVLVSPSINHNRLGDTVTIYVDNIGQYDTMYARAFLCGYADLPANVSLTIKDQTGKILSEHAHFSDKFGHNAKVPVREFIFSQPVNQGLVDVYFGVNNKMENLNGSWLLITLRIQ